MTFYLLDENLNLLQTIEKYESYIWTTRYNESGDFEFYLPATDDLIAAMQQNRYIVRDDDLTQCMIIENVRIDTDIETGNHLTITGRSLKSILDRRIIWSQTTLNGRVENCIRQLINENAVNPSIAARKINKLMLGATLGITNTMSAQYTGDNLGETISAICKNYKLGYDVLLDLDNKKFIFILFKGSDRSYNQSTNPRVIFSNEFENLLRTNYENNRSEFKNVALIAGEGEGAERVKTSVGTAADLARYELYVDARDVSSDNGIISASDYTNLLIERGNEALSETVITESIDGEVEANYTFKLNEDYFLGDVISVKNEYGIETTPRITEVIESEDTSGHYVIPTFATDEN